jgi:1,2-diacylglycerol 3-beta-galactosyltransferase
MKKKIVLLYGDTGGGHRSAAQAIAQGIHATYGDAYDVALANGLSNMPPFISAFTDTYPMWVSHARMLYALGFHASNNRRRIIALRSVLDPLSEKTAEVVVENNPADVYVSCHLLFNQSLPSAIKRLRRQTPFIHVVTDLVSGHVAHYVTDADFLCVPTEQSRKEAIRNFMPRSKIAVTGQPVAPDFRQRLGNREQTRRALGLQDNRLTILLVGGGDGMGRLEVTARHLALSNLPIQLIVVCGRNQTVKENLEFMNPRVPTRILGFVNNIPELMGAADALVTKAGPGTICEAFIAGLPMILYDAVPGQEEGNVDYVVDGGAGAWCPTPWAVLRQLKSWLSNPDRFHLAGQASARLAKPNSVLDIARIVARFAEGQAQPRQQKAAS